MEYNNVNFNFLITTKFYLTCFTFDHQIKCKLPVLFSLKFERRAKKIIALIHSSQISDSNTRTNKLRFDIANLQLVLLNL